MKKILFIQPKSYYDALGVDIDNSFFEATYGIFFSFNIRKELMCFDVIVNCLDHDLSARKICRMANELNIPTMYLMDGIFESNNAVNNWAFKSRNISQFDEKIYDIILTPTGEHMDYLRSHGVSASIFYPKRIYFDVDNSMSKEFDFIITTANTPYFDEPEFQKLTSIIEKTYHEIIKLNYSVIFRIFDNRLLNELSNRNINVINIVDCDISKAINKCRCLITTMSSIIIPCVNQQYPVIMIRHRDYNECDLDVRNVVDLNTSLNNLDDIIIKSIEMSKNTNWFSSSKDIGFKFSKDFINSRQNLFNKSTFVPTKYGFSIYISFSYVIRYVYKKYNLYFIKRYIKWLVHEKNSSHN